MASFFFLFICQIPQLYLVDYCHAASGQLYHALGLEILEHSGDDLSCRAQMAGDYLVGDFQRLRLTLQIVLIQ